MVKRYPAYKHSGTEWLGNVPSGWQILRLKDVSWITPSNVDKKSYDGQLSVRLCNYTDVYYNEQITNDMDLMAATADPEEIRKFSLRAGQVIITKDSESAADIGIAAFVPKDLPGVVCGYHLSVIQCTDKAEGRFIKRLFDSTYVKSVLATRANGLTRVGLGQAALATIPIPVPPVDEQRQIADYLDAQTAKIDALIGKQERLIEMLAERRQAVISHAVTKGLDPNAPMKESGVEWLGDIPGGWLVSRLKHLAAVQTGLTLGKEVPSAEAIELPYLRVANVQTSGVNLDEVKTVLVDRAEWTKYRLRDGDVLMTEGGDIDKLGRGCIWRNQVDPCVHQNHVFAVRCGRNIYSRLLVYLLDAQVARNYFRVTAKKTTNLASTNSTTLGNLPLALPALPEQVRIVEHLDRETSQIDAISAKAREMIEVLKERRQALISAAVTGKIDVRTTEAQ